MIDRVARAAGIEPAATGLCRRRDRTRRIYRHSRRAGGGARDRAGCRGTACRRDELCGGRRRVRTRGPSCGPRRSHRRDPGRCWSLSTAGAPIFTSSFSPRIARRRWPNLPRSAGPARLLCRRADRRRGAGDRRRYRRACRRRARPDRPVGIDARTRRPTRSASRPRRCSGWMPARRPHGGAAALPAPSGRDIAEGDEFAAPAVAPMSPRIVPLPAGRRSRCR